MTPLPPVFIHKITSDFFLGLVAPLIFMARALKGINNRYPFFFSLTSSRSRLRQRTSDKSPPDADDLMAEMEM